MEVGAVTNRAYSLKIIPHVVGTRKTDIINQSCVYIVFTLNIQLTARVYFMCGLVSHTKCVLFFI